MSASARGGTANLRMVYYFDSPGEMESSESSESDMNWTNEEDGIAGRQL